MTMRQTWRQTAALRALAVKHGMLDGSRLLGHSRELYEMLTPAELEEMALLPAGLARRTLRRLVAERGLASFCRDLPPPWNPLTPGRVFRTSVLNKEQLQ